MTDFKFILEQIKIALPQGITKVRVSPTFPFMMRREAQFNDHSVKFADPEIAERTLCHGWYDRTFEILTVSPALHVAMLIFTPDILKQVDYGTTKRNIQPR